MQACQIYLSYSKGVLNSYLFSKYMNYLPRYPSFFLSAIRFFIQIPKDYDRKSVGKFIVSI